MEYKLLIVDDNYMQIQSLLSYMNWGKFGISEIRTAHDGMEGLDVFKSFLPDIVITDVVMPEMNGIELTKEIRKLNRKTKFLFISCYEDFKYLKEAMENEVISYVLKPIKPNLLEESVNKVLSLIEHEIEHDSMNTLLKESIEIYRKNFFYKLIYSRYIDINYLKNAIHNLEFNKFNAFIIVDFDIICTKGRFIDIYNLLNLTEKNLFLRESGMMVVENEMRMVAMFMGVKTEDNSFVENVKSIVEHYRNVVKVEYNINLNVGMSNVHQSLYDANVMLEEAASALENNLSFCEDGLYVYDDLIYANPSYNILELKDALNELINNNTEEQIDLFVNRFCFKSNYFNTYSAKTLSINIFTVLQLLLNERNLMGENVLKKMTVIWSQINMMDKIDDVINWLTYVLKSTLDLICIREKEGYEKLISDINDEINNNFNNITSVGQIAASVYISESYARKIYKKYTGKTIFEALLVKRMEEAKKLLSNPDMTTNKVANLIGYRNKQHFLDAFKRYTGYLPREFKAEKVRKDYGLHHENK